MDVTISKDKYIIKEVDWENITYVTIKSDSITKCEKRRGQ